MRLYVLNKFAMLRLFLLFFLFNRIFADPYDGYDVSQIHIAQGKDPSAMTISWVTKSSADTQVRFGLKPEELVNVAYGNVTSYNFDYPEYGVYESGVIHHVFLTNLEPDTIYYYECGDFSVSQTSGTLYFKTLPKVGDPRPISFAVIGDLGQTQYSLTTLEHVLENRRLQLILHAGDLSYADCDQQRWDSYGMMIEVLAKERYAYFYFYISLYI